MVDGGLPDRLLAALHQGQDGHGVLGGVVRDLIAGELGEGGEEVHQAHGLLTGGAGLDVAGPADDHGHPVAALPDVGLGAPEDVVGVVAVLSQRLKAHDGGTAVVAGEHHDGVVGDALLIQLGLQPADEGIHLEHEVPVGTQAGLALELVGGQQRSVDGQGGIVDEEGFFLAGPLVDQVQHLLVAGRHCLFQVEAAPGRAFVVEELRAGGGVVAVIAANDAVGYRLGHVVLDEHVGGLVQGGGHAEVVVETLGVGTVLDGFGVVQTQVVPALVHLGHVDGELGVAHRLPVHAQVPFAHAGGAVALLLEHGGDGLPPRLDQGPGHSGQHQIFQFGAPVVPAGHQCVPGGGAHGGRGVAVGKAHALPGQPINVLGVDLGLGVHAGHVAVAQIVGEEEDDIGLLDIHVQFLPFLAIRRSGSPTGNRR